MDLMILAEESMQYAGFLAPLAFPLLIASAGFSAYSAYQGQKAQQSQAENAAAISEYNTQVSEQDATAAEMSAEAAAERQQRQGAELQATQKAQYGRSGVLFGGSPLTVMADTASQLELDRQMILYEGATTASRYRSKAKGQRMEADAYSSQAKSYGRAAPLAGASALTS